MERQTLMAVRACSDGARSRSTSKCCSKYQSSSGSSLTSPPSRLSDATPPFSGNTVFRGPFFILSLSMCVCVCVCLALKKQKKKKKKKKR